MANQVLIRLSRRHSRDESPHSLGRLPSIRTVSHQWAHYGLFPIIIIKRIRSS
jgi:hypothetical protein